ncbi:hypothetical protein M409DRAFT_21608 [Zasmidium cellare ATCC 36951]|uniref:F-box domain-containing protein n=1 Tax=Zasmidium cellare ATCC 36951 TaxID=1080233 RepID=A0A6A6CNF0_ZASCE|nr:uncharacterized protein M409DRAFT_21608 [Zasmidium cellare ATCC 36951]KAF2168163.1 hypothetical protein M409DRAFT_21608 [Zasmidium cellare ATCC 36951]
MPSQKSHLLELPEEMRLEIYEYLVKPAEIRILSTGGIFYKEPSDNELHLAVLQTCRIIWEEASPLLSSPSLLSLQPTAGPFFLHPRPPSIGALKSLFRREAKPFSFLAGYLKKDLRLKSLKLVVEDYLTAEHNKKLDYIAGHDEEDAAALEEQKWMIDVWSWLRPSQTFSFVLEIERCQYVAGKGGWDNSKGEAVWTEERVEMIEQDKWYDEDRHRAIVNTIKKAFPVP